MTINDVINIIEDEIRRLDIEMQLLNSISGKWDLSLQIEILKKVLERIIYD